MTLFKYIFSEKQENWEMSIFKCNVKNKITLWITLQYKSNRVNWTYWKIWEDQLKKKKTGICITPALWNASFANLIIY